MIGAFSSTNASTQNLFDHFKIRHPVESGGPRMADQIRTYSWGNSQTTGHALTSVKLKKTLVLDLFAQIFHSRESWRICNCVWLERIFGSPKSKQHTAFLWVSDWFVQFCQASLKERERERDMAESKQNYFLFRVQQTLNLHACRCPSCYQWSRKNPLGENPARNGI